MEQFLRIRIKAVAFFNSQFPREKKFYFENTNECHHGEHGHSSAGNMFARIKAKSLESRGLGVQGHLSGGSMLNRITSASLHAGGVGVQGHMSAGNMLARIISASLFPFFNPASSPNKVGDVDE
jgi:hypothetical protein